MVVFWFLAAMALLSVAATEAARHLCRQPAGPPRALAAVVVGWSWMTVGTELLGSLGQLRPIPLTLWAASGLILGLGWRWFHPAPAGPAKEGSAGRVEVAATASLALLVWASTRLGLISLLFPVKVVSDGPIYHLYFAARWWKAARIFPVASPFGEVGATYFWANGDLWFAWLMTFGDGDLLAKVGQVPFFVVAGLAAFALARESGAGVSASMIASAWFCSVGPFLIYAFEPNVDVIFVAGYLLAVYFFLRYARGTDGGASLALGALAAGLAMGTKPTGIVFIPPLLVLVALAVWLREDRYRARAGRLGLLVLGTALTMGYWPLKNAILTGNPLYPIHVGFGGRAWLPGWFEPKVMERSPYFLPIGDWRAFVDILLAVLDPRMLPVWSLAIVGAWKMGRDRASARWVGMVSALAVANVLLYWVAIPYRTQQRFMLQALGLATVPLAVLLDRSWWSRGLGAALLAVHLLTPQVWPVAAREPEIPWDQDARIPNISPAPIVLPAEILSFRPSTMKPEARHRLGPLAGLGIGSALVAACWARWVHRPGVSRGSIALAGSVALVAYGAWTMNGPSRLRLPPFPEYINGWMDLEMRSGPDGVRVAYAGIKIPYYLMGGRLQNEVRYVNVDEHRDWLMHDYHRAAGGLGLPTLWDNPFPGWDRLRPDYRSWLANLRAERIQILVVAKVNPREGAHNVADREWFPIERRWADSHPEVFQPLYGVAEQDPQIRLYGIRPENE